jgi:hypothetical protein
VASIDFTKSMFRPPRAQLIGVQTIVGSGCSTKIAQTESSMKREQASRILRRRFYATSTSSQNRASADDRRLPPSVCCADSSGAY